MALVFEKIQDMYQRSIQPGSKVEFKSKYFMQYVLYTFDEVYFLATTVRQLLAEKGGNPLPLEKCFLDLSEDWCKTFSGYFMETKMGYIINTYYRPIYENDSKRYKHFRNDKHNKIYTIIPPEKLYPKIFREYLINHDIDGSDFGLPSITGKKVARTTYHVSNDMFKHIEDQVLNERISMIISNLRTVPEAMIYNEKFIETIINHYKPEFKEFLSVYVQRYSSELMETNNNLLYILYHVILGERKLDKENNIMLFKTMYSTYEDATGKKIKRNLCKSDYLEILAYE